MRSCTLLINHIAQTFCDTKAQVSNVCKLAIHMEKVSILSNMSIYCVIIMTFITVVGKITLLISVSTSSSGLTLFPRNIVLFAVHVTIL